MPVQLERTSPTSTDTGNVPFGWSAVAGRLLLVWYWRRDNGSAPSAPPGYTLLQGLNPGSFWDGHNLFAKIAAGGESSSGAINGGANVNSSVTWAAEVSGGPRLVTDLVSALNNSSATGPSLAALAGGMVFGSFCNAQDGAAPGALYTPGAGYSELLDGGLSTFHPKFCVINRAIAANGNYAPDVTSNPGGNISAITLSIPPAESRPAILGGLDGGMW